MLAEWFLKIYDQEKQKAEIMPAFLTEIYV